MDVAERDLDLVTRKLNLFQFTRCSEIHSTNQSLQQIESLQRFKEEGEEAQVGDRVHIWFGSLCERVAQNPNFESFLCDETSDIETSDDL